MQNNNNLQVIESVVNKYQIAISQSQKENTSNVSVGLKLDRKPTSLMDALSQGVAYQIKDDKVYIWYKPMKGFKGSAFLLLVGYEVFGPPQYYKHYMENMVKFYLSPYQKL